MEVISNGLDRNPLYLLINLSRLALSKLNAFYFS